jgi:hypothetical protein
MLLKSMVMPLIKSCVLRLVLVTRVKNRLLRKFGMNIKTKTSSNLVENLQMKD